MDEVEGGVDAEPGTDAEKLAEVGGAAVGEACCRCAVDGWKGHFA